MKPGSEKSGIDNPAGDQAGIDAIRIAQILGGLFCAAILVWLIFRIV